MPSKYGKSVLTGVLAIVFVPLFAAAPAQADWVVGIGNVTGACVQFDWRGGTATYSGHGAGQFTVDVNNTIDNRIGGGSMPDSWSIWVNGSQVVSSTVVERSQVTVDVPNGDWVVTVQGIDRGFWAGWYGPQFCNPTVVGVPVVVPHASLPLGDYVLNEGSGTRIVAPAGMVIDHVTAWYGDPNDGANGADWSARYTEQLHGLASADLNSGNLFGDPVPGVYKVLIASVTFMAAPVVAPVEPLPTPEPTNTPAPVETPSTTPTATPEPVSVDVRTVDVREPEPVTQDVRTEDVRPSEPPTPEPTQPTPPVVPVLPSVPAVEPTTAPEPISAPVSQPEPVPTPQPIPQPEPVAAPEPTPAPEPAPVPAPAPEPAATAPDVPAAETPTPVPAPVDPVTPPIPAPPSETVAPPKPEPVPAPAKPTTVPAPPVATVEKPEPKLAETVPTLPSNPSPAEISAVISQANTILDSAEPGSPVYEEALNALAEAAQADDPQVPETLANIPGVGQAAAVILNAFNTLGNLGADISPHVRKKMKQVGSAVIVLGITAGAGIRRLK